jgi:peptidyl-prolyl cis-trans isomerase C
MASTVGRNVVALVSGGLVCGILLLSVGYLTSWIWSSAPAEQVAGAVTVNGVPITEADIRFAEADLGHSLLSMTPEQQRKALIEFLIDGQLFAAAARAEGLDSGSAFEAKVNYATRKALRDQFFAAKLANRVSETDLRQAYEDQLKDLKPQEEYRARHILVENAVIAADIRRRLTEGGSFGALAQEFSRDAATSANGGDLGYVGMGQLDPVFESAALGLARGELSQPVQTRFGWHVIKLEDRRTRPFPEFDAVKDALLLELIAKKTQEAARSLRKSATIIYVNPRDGLDPKPQ